MGRFVLKDSFYKKAKQEGFRARSAYKLKEIDKKFRLIGKGHNVLDLGCAPGSFLQVLSEMVGEKGMAVGIDMLPTPPLPAKNIRAIKADIRETAIGEVLSGLPFSSFDVITCDIAPNLSGIREVDDARIEELFNAVIRIVDSGLKPGGHFTIKSFFTTVQKKITDELKRRFEKVATHKPAASRSVSSELYFVCMGKRSFPVEDRKM